MSIEPPANVALRTPAPGELPMLTRLAQSRGMLRHGLDLENTRVYVADDAGSVAGVVGLEMCDTHGLLRTLCVAQEWEGRGIGQALVERVLTDGAIEALDAVYLASRSDAASRFFARFGFRPIERSELPFDVRRAMERAGGAPVGATIMRLVLTPL